MKKTILYILLSLLLASTLYADEPFSSISLYSGPDWASYVDEAENFYFRTSLRTDIFLELINHRAGLYEYGPFFVSEITTPTLDVNGTRYLSHYGLGVGYSVKKELCEALDLGLFTSIAYGTYVNSDIKYVAFDLGVISSYEIEDSLRLKAKGALSWKGNIASLYLQLGAGYEF